MPTFPRFPPIPPSIAPIAQEDPSVEAPDAQQHPSNSPSEGMFYDQSQFYEMPPAFRTRQSFFFLFPLLAHPHTRMFQIKPKLRTTKIFLLMATIVPSKFPMLPPSRTPTALPPPPVDSSTRLSPTTV